MEQALYALPEGWEWFSVKNLSNKVQYGYTTKACEKGNAQFLRITDIQNGQIQWGGVPFVSVSDEELEKYCLHEDDLVFARSGATSGKSILIASPPRNSIFASYLIRVVPDTKVVFPKFLELFFQSPVYWKQVGANVSGAAQPNINGTKLSAFQVSLPSLNEQKRIVAKLDALFTRIDTAITHLQQTFELSKALFASALDEAFNPTSNQNQLPEGWSWKNFKDVCQLKRGYDLPKKSRVEGNFPLYSANGATDCIDQFKVKGPGVVTGRSGTIGKVHFVDNDFWPLNTALYVQNFKGNNEKFIHYFLVIFDLTRFASGAAVPTLNRNSLSSEVVCIPDSIKEQNRIVTYLDALSERTRALEATTQEKLNDLTTLKASLLDAAFKGQL